MLQWSCRVDPSLDGSNLTWCVPDHAVTAMVKCCSRMTGVGFGKWLVGMARSLAPHLFLDRLGQDD